MRVTVTARHVEVTEELRTRARELLTRLARVASRPHDGQVIFTEDHGTPVAEVRLHTVRGQVLVGVSDGTDHRSALDKAVARVRRQLDKPTGKTGHARARVLRGSE
ncbi:MAG TPA: HPF/RaiA family ribosome-associated protein [Gemmatimonadales bacterium]|nr:HPF/RaiA family ribosome-associated protein [Gemmatimonadales bacterium]